MIFKIMNFAIFAALLGYFLKKPLKKFLVKRSEDAASEISAAGEIFRKAAEEEKIITEKIDNFAAEAEELRLEATRRADLAAEALISNAKTYAVKASEDARMAIEHLRSGMRSEIKAKIAEQAISLAGKRIVERLGDKDQMALLEKGMSAL